MKKIILAAATMLIAVTNNAWAAEQIQVTKAWARATVAGQQASGVFMQIKTEKDTTLIAAESPAAQTVEIHEMLVQDNVMKMRELEKGLPLPANQEVTLAPGGYHIMLLNLKEQLKEGQEIQMTLTMEDKKGEQEKIELKIPVKHLTKKSEKHQHNHEHGHEHKHK